MRVVAALDVGGTSVTAGHVHRATVRSMRRFELDSTAPADQVLDELAGAARFALAGAGPTSADLAIAFPWPFDVDAGTPLLRGQRKFDSIHGVDLRSELRSRVARRHLRIGIVNDAAAAAVGEAHAGAGRGHRRVLMLMLGTGLGAAMTVDGAEVPELAGVVVGDLWRIDWDEARADDLFSATGLARAIGVDPSQLWSAIDDTGSGRADPAPFREFGCRLGRFLRSTVGSLEPEVVVLGGGGARAFPLLSPGLAAELDVPVVPATLGPSGPLLGAATAQLRSGADHIR